MSGAINIGYDKLQVTGLWQLPPGCVLLYTMSCFCGLYWHHKWVGLGRAPQRLGRRYVGLELCPVLMPVLFQRLLSMVHTRKPHPLQWTVPGKVFCQGILRVCVSPGLVSCGISGRRRVEQCLGRVCLPALFLSCDGRILTWPLRPPRSWPAHWRLSPHESWASTSWHVSSSWRETTCSQRGRNRRIKGVSAMTVLSFHLVTSQINLF